ncbi:PGF-CTERM sorting domain-containing protein [Halosimplex litoreum]|uniref:PGF-CTERM sorting domain-containing protein n=1 Tax=Halosimplex litoreum TaxID=1198301 RepID=A0A7T3KTW8_9EURY|nr:PGF-CTERM sorting domain-containing protein [Halosimplex litoreum]QPV61434.1 PGF-CTERM sorting domain-containing protein [Halosimplex litoreum]
MTVDRPSDGRVAVVGIAVLLAVSAGAFAAVVSGSVDSHVTIEEDAVEQAAGDVARFALSVPSGESVAVVVDGAGGERRLNLTDADGDGRIALALNSYLAGPDATVTDVYGVGEGDRLSVEGEATGRLPPGSYRLAAYANGTGEPADTAGLTLTEPGLGNATVMVAPNGSREHLDSLAAIERARERGWLTRTNEVALSDTLVLRLTVPGVAGAVANESGATDEARFRRLLAGSNASLLLSERMPGPSRPRQHLSLDWANTTTVVADPDNDTYYAAADLTALPWGSSHDHEVDEWSFDESFLVDGTDYVPRLVVGEHRLNPGDISEGGRTGEIRIFQPDATVTFPMEEGGTVPLAPAPNQGIAGWTNLAPGSTVTVTLSDGAGDPFPVTETVRVTRERPPENEAGARYRFRAEFDLRGAAPRTTFDIRVRSNGTQLGPLNSWEEGEGYRGYVDPVLAPTDTPTTTPAPTTTQSPTPHEPSTAPPPSTVTVHIDDGITPTPQSTADPSSTARRTATSGDGPGFGAVATLLGLVGAVLLAARRGDARR